MLMPSIFGENLFDEWMDFPFGKDLSEEFRRDFNRDFFGRRNPLYGKNEKKLMKTDVRETDNTYELDIDLPGFKKEEVSAKLENGYLTISASKGLNKDEKDKEGNYIRRERYTGQCARSFYVGEGVRQEDIHAKFEDGILKLSIPKEVKNQIEENNYIAIEG
ncbi:MAG: Hsp20/alpha crystallin family protein [Clostridiaceae bacterium]|nr:Hsp20/alpha crystallin family protein [Clostridiaceae bacterium]